MAQSGKDSPWKVAEARVVTIDKKGGLGWGVGAPAEEGFAGGRDWRGDGAVSVVHRTITFSSIFASRAVAEREATSIRRTLFQESQEVA